MQTTHSNTALRRWQQAVVVAAFGATLLAGVLVVLSLAAHRSQSPLVWSRFSWPVAAMGGGASLGLLALAVVGVRHYTRLTGVFLQRLAENRADQLVLVLLLASSLVAGTFAFPPFGFMATLPFRAALVLILLVVTACLVLRLLLASLGDSAVAGLWATGFGAWLIVLAAHLGVGQAWLRWITLLGPAAGFTLIRGVPALALPRLWPQVRARASWLAASLATLALAGLLALTYGEATQHAIMNNDEVFWLNHVAAHPGLGAILEPATTVFVRPFFQLQAFFNYQLFGFQYSWYVVVQLALVWLSALALMGVSTKLSGSLLFGALVAGVVVTHRFVSSLVGEWAIDTVTLNAVLAVLVIWLVAFGRPGRLYYAQLALLLLLGCLSRESGLVMVGAVATAAVLRLRHPGPERARAARELALALVVVLAYFAFRRAWLGTVASPALFIQEACLVTRLYWQSEMASLAPVQLQRLVAYTTGANLTAPFVPALFDSNGCLTAGNWLPGIALGLLAAGTTAVCQRAEPLLRGPAASSRQALGWRLALVGACAISGALLHWVASYVADVDYRQALDLWLHTAITLMVALTLLRLRPVGRTQWQTAALAAGIWLASAATFFVYFRFRNFYVLTFAWALLIALGWSRLRWAGRPQAYARATLAVMLASLLVVNVVRVRQTIPANFLLIENFDDRDYWVCWPGISAEFAQAWAAYYALDDEVAGCRAAARCNPATWQLPYTEGRPAWHPPGQQVC